MIKITSDSTCDLGNELIEKYNVGIFPLTVILGAEEYRDGQGITPQMIFDYVAQNKVLPKTAAASVLLLHPDSLQYAQYDYNMHQP